MKRLILALAFLIGLFALSGAAANAYAQTISRDRADLAARAHYQTVEWRHHYWHRPYAEEYYYYEPYYYYYPYPYSYYYGPGFSINTPFFGFSFP